MEAEILISPAQQYIFIDNKTYIIDYMGLDYTKIDGILKYTYRLNYLNKTNIIGSIRIDDLIDPIIFLDYHRENKKCMPSAKSFRIIDEEQFELIYNMWLDNRFRVHIIQNHIDYISKIHEIDYTPTKRESIEIIKDYKKIYNEIMIQDIIE